MARKRGQLASGNDFQSFFGPVREALRATLPDIIVPRKVAAINFASSFDRVFVLTDLFNATFRAAFDFER